MYKLTRSIKVIAFVLLAVSLNCSNSNEGKVIGIKDGDTIEILVNNTPVRVRLFGIDCPEKTQAFGTRAREFTSQLSFGKIVKLKSHGTDRYGRTIGEIILPDGRSLNKEILKAGYGWVYRDYTKDPELIGFENHARIKHLGLWQDNSPVAPWEFRHRWKVKTVNASVKEKKNFGQCQALTRKGNRCKNKAISEAGFCKVHSKTNNGFKNN